MSKAGSVWSQWPVSILQKSRVQLHPMTGSRRMRSHRGVNPSEIKGSVTRSDPPPRLPRSPVSILQKSRVQLHLKAVLQDRGFKSCQSFRNQGFSYTSGLPLESALQQVCQSFRNQGFSYTPTWNLSWPAFTKCQSFRNQGFSYTVVFVAAPMSQLLCQSFRNQGFSYTDEESAKLDADSCVNPSEIKGSVTPTAKIPSEYQRVTTPFCLAGVNFVKRNIKNREF